MKKYAFLALLVIPISIFAMDEMLDDAEQADGVTSKRTYVEAFGDEETGQRKVIVLEKRVSDPQFEKLKEEAQYLDFIKKFLYELYAMNDCTGRYLPDLEMVKKYRGWVRNHLREALGLYEEKYSERDTEVSDDE